MTTTTRDALDEKFRVLEAELEEARHDCEIAATSYSRAVDMEYAPLDTWCADVEAAGRRVRAAYEALHAAHLEWQETWTDEALAARR